MKLTPFWVTSSLLLIGTLATASELTFSQVAPQSLILGSTQTIDLSLKAAPGFKGGDISLSIDRAKLDPVDTEQDVEVTVTPATVQLTAGETVSLQVKFAVRDRAPSFARAFAAVVANLSPDRTERATISLQVQPIFEIRLYSGDTPLSAPMKWSTDAGDKITELRRHATGVKIRWVNYDTNGGPTGGHYIHATSAFDLEPSPHQPLLKDPMAPAAKEGEAGGSYSYLFKPQEPFTILYWCHDIENGTRPHIIRFNSR